MLAAGATCTAASRRGRWQRQLPMLAMSCRHRTSRRSLEQLFCCGPVRLLHHFFTRGGQRIETTAGAIFAGGNLRIFPTTFQQTHFFQPAERTVQRAVRGQKTAFSFLAQTLRHLVTVKLAADLLRAGSRAFYDYEM